MRLEHLKVSIRLRMKQLLITFGVMYFSLFFTGNIHPLGLVNSNLYEIRSSFSITNYFETYFEEFEEMENELLFFEKTGYVLESNRILKIEKLVEVELILRQYNIQNHLLNLPPPFIT